MLVALLAILVIECVAFNMPFWTTLGASTDSAAATNVMGDGLKRGEDGILTVTDPTSAYMEVSADGTSSYVRIEAANTPEGGDVKAASNVFVRADTDSRTGEITSVSTSAPRSLYLKVKPGSSVRLWIEEPVGSRIPFSAVRANVRVPFEFSWLRVSIMAAVALLVALWRPGSALWRIRLNPASVRQRWALVAFLAPLAIYTTVRIVGEFLVSGPLVFPNPHGYTYDFDQYDHVAQSLLNGRVWLDLPVSPELAQAANPHDILVRGQLFESGKTQIFWDYAFYGGHWYSYFGVVPVVLFFLPFRAITSLWTPGGMMLPTSVCILLMMFLFAVFACLLVIRLTHRLCPNASVAATSIVIVMFLLGSNASYLHFRLNFYSVPFAASLMFTTLGLWLWLKATPERHPGRGEHVHVGSWSVAGAQPLSLRYLAAGAACIAANFGCRPTFALSALLCFPIFWPQITSLLQGLKSRSLPPRRALRAPAAVIIPALIVVLPLMAYNVARFGSPLDFGNDYQMTVTDMTRFVQPTANFLPSVGAYLFLSLRFTSEFPFIGMTPIAFREWGYYELMAGGLFTACPLLLLALAAPFLRRRMHRSGYWGLATCSLALAVLLAVFDSHTAGLGWRYICDFGWMMAIAALAPMLYLMHPDGDAIVASAPDPSERNEPRRDVTKRHPMVLACVRGLVAAVLMASIILAVLACFIPGRDDSLINNNPVLYDTVVAWFRL